MDKRRMAACRAHCVNADHGKGFSGRAEVDVPLGSSAELNEISPLELRHLRYFVAVAEELNFTRAAKRLYIAQPPLSTQIRLLEEELGAQLFERDKRKVFLTQAGKQMLERARDILAAADEAQKMTRRAADGEIGEVHLGYAASAMFSDVLPQAIRRFRARLPQVRLTVHEMPSIDQLVAIHNRELNAGVVRRPEISSPAGVVIEEWYRAPLVAAIPSDHVLAESASIRISDLKDHPLITFPRNSGIGLYWRLYELCMKAGFHPRIAKEARDYAIMVGLVAAGVGVAVVPADAQCIKLTGVVYRPLLGNEGFSALHIARRIDENDNFVLQLIEELRAGTQVV